MSRVGKRPIPVPAGVEVRASPGSLAVKGPKGALSRPVPAGLSAQVEKGLLWIRAESEDPALSALHGLTRRLAANMLEGVTRGYAKELEIQGVGFKAAVQGRTLELTLGFAAPKPLALPEGIEVKVADGVRLTVSGADKQAVGDTAARIRSFYPAEPYKGKGIRYKGEHVRRKVGKTVT